jgi:hypothetical protein
MRALESSPVHCLKQRPSGKRRRPENGGTIAILRKELGDSSKLSNLTDDLYHPVSALLLPYYARAPGILPPK